MRPLGASEVEPAVRNLADFFFGAGNTWTFDSQTGRILLELIASWSRMAGRFTPGDRVLFNRFCLADSLDSWWRYVQARQKF